MAKIVIDFNEDQFILEKEVREQLKNKKTTWQDIKDAIEEVDAKVKEHTKALNALKLSYKGEPSNLLSLDSIRKEEKGLVVSCKILAILAERMSKLALKNSHNYVVNKTS